MASSNDSSVYISVIEDVVAKVRDEFITYGVGDVVLNQLQALWETKMRHCGAISGGTDRAMAPAASPPPVHDLNVPYDVTSEEYATPTAEMLFPPTPLQTPIHTPLPGEDLGMYYNMPTGQSDYYAPSPISDTRNGVAMNGAAPSIGRPSPFMQPPAPWMNQRPLGVDVNVAYEESREVKPEPLTQDFLAMYSGKRKSWEDEYPAGQLPPGSFVPQQDGTADQVPEFVVSSKDNARQVWYSIMKRQESAASNASSVKETAIGPVLPQQDGVHDTGGDDDDDEPPLNEDDDDEDDTDEVGNDEPNTQDLVLAQFDKVGRAKNRWKCALRDGIMHLNGRDVLFNKASGEFDF